jgi:hypothetical protein
MMDPSLDRKEEYDPRAIARLDKTGASFTALSVGAAITWTVGTFVTSAALLGGDKASAVPLLGWLAIPFVAFAPSLIMLLAGAAAREAARANAMAKHLAWAAETMLTPSQRAEAAARSLSQSIRGEIGALDDALASTLTKLRDVDDIVSRQSASVDRAARLTQENAGQMISGLEKERAQLLAISDELGEKSAAIGGAIARQAQAILAASRQAETDLRSADAILDNRMKTVQQSAGVIQERTSALLSAAQGTSDSAQRLENALAEALDSLAEATRLTDTAKKSAQEAAYAANMTAGAIREETNRAIEGARRAAELIRNEALSVERDASAALTRLRDGRNDVGLSPSATRDISAPPTRTEKPVQSNGKRGFFFGGGKASNKAAATPAPATENSTPEEFFARLEAMRTNQAPDANARKLSFSEQMAGLRPGGAKAQTKPAPQSAPTSSPTASPSRTARENWTWRDLLETDESDELSPGAFGPRATAATKPAIVVNAAPNDFPVFKPALHSPSVTALVDAFAPRPVAHGASRMTQLLAEGGISLDACFSMAALDRIAGRARNGTQARRRAVRDASPDMVDAVMRLMLNAPEARTEAAEFLRIEGARLADLLGRGRASMSAESTRLFLLIDAASS